MIEQDAIGMHAFTRHLLARDGGDDDGDAACESQGDEDDDSDSDSSQRKSAQKKFSALQQQMLHAGGSDAGASQSEPPLDAVNMDELSAGLLDDSVRYWSDFQQVTCSSQRVMLVNMGTLPRDPLHAERIPRAILLPFAHRSRSQRLQLLRRPRFLITLTQSCHPQSRAPSSQPLSQALSHPTASSWSESKTAYPPSLPPPSPPRPPSLCAPSDSLVR